MKTRYNNINWQLNWTQFYVTNIRLTHSLHIARLNKFFIILYTGENLLKQARIWDFKKNKRTRRKLLDDIEVRGHVPQEMFWILTPFSSPAFLGFWVFLRNFTDWRKRWKPIWIRACQKRNHLLLTKVVQLDSNARDRVEMICLLPLRAMTLYAGHVTF